MIVNIRIDRLVVDDAALEGLNQQQLAEAIRLELGVRIAAEGLSDVQSSHRHSHAASTNQPATSKDVANAIYGSLRL